MLDSKRKDVSHCFIYRCVFNINYHYLLITPDFCTRMLAFSEGLLPGSLIFP